MTMLCSSLVEIRTGEATISLIIRPTVMERGKAILGSAARFSSDPFETRASCGLETFRMSSWNRLGSLCNCHFGPHNVQIV